jgi:hypothetical protein
MKITWIALLAGGVLMHSFAFADVSYQETTQYTGGSMMGMLKMAGAFSSQAKQATSPVTSTVMIHGGRMLRSNPHTTEIIDLDAQMITFIDHDKRTYSMVTFKDIQDQMAKAAAKSKGAPPSSSNGSQMSFNAHISNSGATRQIDGQTESRRHDRPGGAGSRQSNLPLRHLGPRAFRLKYGRTHASRSIARIGSEPGPSRCECD